MARLQARRSETWSGMVWEVRDMSILRNSSLLYAVYHKFKWVESVIHVYLKSCCVPLSHVVLICDGVGRSTRTDRQGVVVVLLA